MRTGYLLCLASLASSIVAWAQAPIILSTDPINLRNFALSNDGGQVVYAASLDRSGLQGGGGPTNIYHTILGATPITTRLTDYKGDEPWTGAMTVALAATGRVAYTLLSSFTNQEEQIRVLDGDTDRVIATDKEGCIRILCVNCYSLCVRNVHITSDGNTVLYSAARDYPFYTVTVNGGVRRRIDTVYQGAVAPSGQRVISQGGRVVFTSSAPFGPTFAPAATDVYTVNLDGTDIRQVTRLGVATSVGSNAVISANGEWIAFERRDSPDFTAQIWAVKPDGSRFHRISSGSAAATSPSLTADGTTIAYVQDGQVMRVPTDIDLLASPIVPMGTKFLVSAAQAPIISADGSRIGFMLGPPSGLPASIYEATATPGLKFEQLIPVYTPRVLFTRGVVSGGGTAAPSVGSLMTAYGANLSLEEFSVAGPLPLPLKLGGVELLANLEAMPLQAVTPWQVNAQLAGSRIPGTVSFRVRDARGDTSAEARALVQATAPEAIPIYSASSGPLLAAAVFPGTRTLADAAHPAAAGDTLEIYSFGLGATDPVVEAGVASPVPPAKARVTPRLRIGGRDAEISFAGLVPGLAGVYQVNAKVPAGLAAGYQPVRWIAADGTIAGTSGIYVR